MSRYADHTVEAGINAAVRVQQLEMQVERTAAEYNDLAQMGAILASILNLEEVLAALMDMAIRMVGGQVGAIVLQTPTGLQPQISWGLDHRVLPSILWEDRPVCERTIATTEGALLAPYIGPPVTVGDLSFRIETVITQAIVTKSETVGCIVIVNKVTGGEFTTHDRLVLQTLVNFASVAVQNARLLAESIEKHLLDHELSLAAQVQKTLVPRSNLRVGGTAIESLYIPARKVGGDYFDILPVRDTGSFLLAIGDVSSKGMPAALLMTAVRSVVRAAAARTGSVADIVNEINRVVCEDLTGQKDMFITFFLAMIDPSAETITYTNAGHPPPFLWRSDAQVVTELGCGGVFLGQFPDFRYGESSERFLPKDRLLAYTDGVVEAADMVGRLYGRDRLGTFLGEHSGLPSGRFLELLRCELEKDYRHADYIDDVTAVLVEFGERRV